MVRNNNNFIYTFLSIVVVLFLVNRFLMPITMVLAIVLLYMMAHEGKVALYMNQITKLFVVIAGMGIVYMVLSIFGGFSALGSSRYAVKEIERGIIYILIAQIIMRSKVDIRKYISIWNMLLTLSVVVAILQFTKVIDMNTILKNFYGDSIQFYNTQFTVLSSFRCGSIFVNPNVFACFLVACLGSHLVVSRKYGCGFMRNIVVYLLCIIGFVLAGSRTGFVLGVVILIYHLFTEGRANQGYAMRFLGTMLFFFLIFVLFMNLTGNIGSGILDDLRLFKVNEGMSNSFGGKNSIFTNLIKQMQPWNYLIGYGPFDYSLSSSFLVDFDLGYFIVYYGLIGIGLYVAMLRSLLHYEFMDGTTDHRLPRMLVVIMIVFGLTAGTYFNLRIFAIYMLMFLPMLANNREGIEA